MGVPSILTLRAGDERHIDHFIVKQVGIGILSRHEGCLHMDIERGMEKRCYW